MKAEALARRIVDALRERGRQAYFVGGCVRDRLLEIESQDYDVATDAEAEEVERLFPGSITVGAHFGVVIVQQDGAKVEVAAFREDHDYRDGRRPSRVSFTPSAERDVARRDFTVNGLLYDPVEDRVLDYVGGREDLERRLIRAIGDPRRRFREDRLRMLRAVRFAARLGFEIEPRTMAAIGEAAPEIETISKERVRAEINRILTEGAARRGFELLDETGLLETILPEVARMKGVAQAPDFHPEGDVWRHTLLMLEGLGKGSSTTLAMGVLLHDVGKPETYTNTDRIRFYGHVERGVEIAERICERLRYSKAEKEQILALVENHMKFMHVHEMRTGRLKRFLRMEGFDEHLELHRLDCRSSHGKLTNWEFVREKQEEFSEEELRPATLVSGRDLIAAGYRPGPAFSAILSEAEDAQLEGRIRDKQQGIAWVRERFEPPEGRRLPTS